MSILNEVRIDDRLATSGQPRPEQFDTIAGEGFTTVINLALPDSDNAIEDEGSVVARAGMNYFNIPVIWEAPRVEQFRIFAALMDGLQDQKVWVHCAMNMRVSCFMYLWHTKCRGMPEAAARSRMLQTWNPDDFPQWKKFVSDVKSQVPGA